MNEYQKTYIDLKKQFEQTDGGPDSIRALYAFKEELEQAEDRRAGEVLVDVYDLLDFKKDAYDLLSQIGDRSDRKVLKRLGALRTMRRTGATTMPYPGPKRRRKGRKRRSGGPS